MNIFKKVFVILIFCLTLSNIYANEQFNIFDAKQIAKEVNKPIFYIVVSAKCSHCAHFVENTIIPGFNKIQSNFVFAMTDITKENNIPKNIQFTGFTPTTYILTPDGQMMASPIKGDFNLQILDVIIEKLNRAYGM